MIIHFSLDDKKTICGLKIDLTAKNFSANAHAVTCKTCKNKLK